MHLLKPKKRYEKNIRKYSKFKRKKRNITTFKSENRRKHFQKSKKPLQKKVWALIKESVDIQTTFGDAKISDKHCNFFINSKNASFENMIDLINFVKKK